jgi:endothelin-converting enzyme/putative endopeptidase
MCVQAVEAALPELIGRLFAQEAFPQSSKDSVTSIFQDIVSAFKDNSHKLSWMDPVTRQKAIDKIENIITYVGIPDHPRNYSTFGPQFGSHYAKNLLITTQDAFSRAMASAGQPTDRSVFLIPPTLVNAYFDEFRNTIVLPAGILQSPFYDPAYPPAMNYGGIGMVGGHELTHSLDSKGRDFDAQAKLEDWWDPVTSREFQQRVDCIIDQYSKFSPMPGYYLNGNLTQGENIADAGGLKTAHTAYVSRYSSEINQPSIVPGLTNEQLFFVGFAQTWCTKYTPAAVRTRVLTDPHSPPQFRVNGASINLPAFADAFKCPLGSPMNPHQRCQIW